MAWRTVFKIKSGVELPGELSTVKSSSKLPRISDPSDKVKPEHLPAGEISGKPKSSSSTDEADKSRGPDSSGPRRRLGQKTSAVAKDEFDKFADEFRKGTRQGSREGTWKIRQFEGPSARRVMM